MPKCSYIHKKKRNVCIGDMRDRVTIELRSLTPPIEGSTDFTETFSTKQEMWAAINSVSGETVFDGTNTERVVTHHVYIRFLAGVTAEDWVLFNDERLDVLTVENLDNRNDFMLLKCTNRGTTANAANEL